MNFVHLLRFVLVVLILAFVAAVAYGVVLHPWISLGLLVAAQLAGMHWAWVELTSAEMFGWQRLWMTVVWPVTMVIGWIGRAQ